MGETGQLKLLDSKVLLLGAGGLGSPAALYLAAAGVGTLGIIDMDVVDASNLQRQILHNTDRIGERKVDSAKKTLTLINPDVNVVTYDVRLGADNILDIIDGYDVIVDGTDNFPTRYLVNDASLLKRIPVVHGSIFRFEGQVTVFNPYEGPCYRCLLPEPPPAELAPSCSEAGVLGVLPGIVGSLQAVESHQGAPRDRRHPPGPAPRLRRPGAELPDLQGPPGPGVPGLRSRRRGDRHRRVRRPVHAPRHRGARRLSAGGPGRLMADDLLARRLAQACTLRGSFTLRSGSVSDRYFDKYLFACDPVLLSELAGRLAPLIPRGTEVLAGLELGGVPLATALSLASGIPAAFVRKEAKAYGTAKLAEGAPVEGRRVVIVEDVVTTGGQVALSARELVVRGAEVDTALCVLDRSGGHHDPLREVGITLISLFTALDVGW